MTDRTFSKNVKKRIVWLFCFVTCKRIIHFQVKFKKMFTKGYAKNLCVHHCPIQEGVVFLFVNIYRIQFLGNRLLFQNIWIFINTLKYIIIIFQFKYRKYIICILEWVLTSFNVIIIYYYLHKTKRRFNDNIKNLLQ